MERASLAVSMYMETVDLAIQSCMERASSTGKKHMAISICMEPDNLKLHRGSEPGCDLAIQMCMGSVRLAISTCIKIMDMAIQRYMEIKSLATRFVIEK